jgi:hypothetical protein
MFILWHKTNEVMENFRVTREQILKYNMQDEFPEVFKLETHKWYIVSHSYMQDAIVFLQEEGITNTFGFNHYGEWTEGYSNEHLHKYSKDIVRPATKDEVMNSLIDEATRRGVWDRPMVSAVSGNTNTDGTYYETFEGVNIVLWSRYGRVFDNGEWATAIELTTEDRLERIEKHLGLWKQ